MITLTDAAVEHIKNSLKKRGHGIGFRLSIKKTGCSGYTYVPALIDEPVATDLHFMAQQDLSIYIDPACGTLIKGLVMDSVVDQHMGLKQKKLVFINPNEKNRCGCGESFTVE
ncbi:MAG: iscA [Gammaproteobacteria bacterium]|jgi:iron-sulfur cluster assembly accessory protein|nr:iscA [Gammaproteobacteria bacterium]MCE3237468.1 iscA [Gammaproteobacteria bacterium]